MLALQASSVIDQVEMMACKRVDYDRIASSYNQRFVVGDEMSATASALHRLVDRLDARRILEVGCGTGHWLAGLRSVGSHLHGLDLSAGMLAQARERRVLLHLVQGRARRLPYADASFDLVYCVNAIHHFEEPRAFVSEARRLTQPGGALAIVGMDPRVCHANWYIYDYFDGMLETDLARFPSWATVRGWMAAAGFRQIEQQLLDRIVAPKIGRAVLLDPFLQKDSCSQLALLSDQAYAAGLRRIEAALAQAEAMGKTLTFPVEILVSMLTGWIRT
jgi:ubiquinone/menaquinone biosynthesis C-methylase UbiE